MKMWEFVVPKGTTVWLFCDEDHSMLELVTKHETHYNSNEDWATYWRDTKCCDTIRELVCNKYDSAAAMEDLNVFDLPENAPGWTHVLISNEHVLP